MMKLLFSIELLYKPSWIHLITNLKLMNINTVIYGEAALKHTVLYKLKHYMNVT